jgi:hypothetical protein
MPTAQTLNLRGPALDWAVATARRITPVIRRMQHGNQVDVHEIHDAELVEMDVDRGSRFNPSTDWQQAGQIIESSMISLTPAQYEGWLAWPYDGFADAPNVREMGIWGDTPQEAAMRCYVLRVHGFNVDIPEELI